MAECFLMGQKQQKGKIIVRVDATAMRNTSATVYEEGNFTNKMEFKGGEIDQMKVPLSGQIRISWPTFVDGQPSISIVGNNSLNGSGMGYRIYKLYDEDIFITLR